MRKAAHKALLALCAATALAACISPSSMWDSAAERECDRTTQRPSDRSSCYDRAGEIRRERDR